jgi:hypothetical protein
MAGMKATTARSMFDVLRTCLNVAVEEERIMANPAACVGKFIARSRTEVEIFTPEELTRLLQTTAEEIPAHQCRSKRGKSWSMSKNSSDTIL